MKSTKQKYLLWLRKMSQTSANMKTFRNFSSIHSWEGAACLPFCPGMTQLHNYIETFCKIPECPWSRSLTTFSNSFTQENHAFSVLYSIYYMVSVGSYTLWTKIYITGCTKKVLPFKYFLHTNNRVTFPFRGEPHIVDVVHKIQSPIVSMQRAKRIGKRTPN